MELIIGITGGVACGKSTAASMLADRLSVPHVDTDRMAKRLMAEDPAIRVAIESEISPRAYGLDGKLDRDWLRNATFSDPRVRDRLNGIVHPIVRQRWTAQVSACRISKGSCLVEIPLLYEVNAAAIFDEVVVVGASPEVQVDRLTKLRGLSDTIARKILASQMNLSDKVKRASRVLWNDSDLATLKRQADYLSAILLKTSA
ncbi:MAG: dephospho-CoA kinase [Chthoniobacterales bacterium]